MAQTIHIRGEGGSIIPMDLPLPEPIADRLAAGLLRRVNPDGTPFTGPAATPAPAPVDAPSGQGPARPGKNAAKVEWVAWARAAHHLSAEAAGAKTKSELMELAETPAATEPSTDLGPDTLPERPQAPGRPAADAPKSEWVDYAYRQGKGTRDDLAVYTRDDLMDLTT